MSVRLNEGELVALKNLPVKNNSFKIRNAIKAAAKKNTTAPATGQGESNIQLTKEEERIIKEKRLKDAVAKCPEIPRDFVAW